MDVVTIEPSGRFAAFSWRDLYENRDLIYFLLRRDLTSQYKQSILGIGWAVLRPVFSMVVFTVIFGNMAKINSDGIPYPIFSFAGLLPWTYFSTSMNASTQSLANSMGMISKVYFPRIIIPLLPIISNLADFFIAFVIMIGLMLWYGVAPSLTLIYLPLLIVMMAFSSLSVGLWMSALAVQYRDVRHAIVFISQILMYAAPVIWPASLIPGKLRFIYGLYPMAGIIEGFRACLLNRTEMPWDLLTAGGITIALTLVSGIYYFKQSERFLVDVA